ncbi:sulfotransferase family protein [Alicyclobacillus sp. ALC3]|uniref:sulfotransferase family protein n=1 Tax=Alicyclobacillus sp. ALC3 TaxID=2796143 RepID=UPI00237952E7|nr:sulfotransferase [Alicyclobacillus sp. ALC3]WDL95536.1 sulfotransferase [Alicyclobacillus sp. ALC3]
MLPNFLIVGAAKSGTSSLDRYLSQHPDIYIPPKKEAHYFSIPDFPPTFQGPGDEGMNQYTVRDRALYEQLFDDVQEQTAVGESSVFYLYYPGTAARIHKTIPAAKVIILLRNPVDRAYSAYTHLIRDERESMSFEDSLAQEQARHANDYEPMWLYRELGLYTEQVKRYFDVFGRDQVKVLLFEEFVREPCAHVREVLAFLGVDPDVPIDTSLTHNESGQPTSRLVYNFISKPNGLKELVKPLVPAAIRERLGLRAKSMVLKKVSMESATRAELEAYFASDIAALAELLQRDLSIWRPRANTSDGRPDMTGSN